MNMRWFGKIRRFNKKIQILFYHLKQNKIKIAFYLSCIVIRNTFLQQWLTIPEQAAPVRTKPGIKPFLVTIFLIQIIFYLVEVYSGSQPKVGVKQPFFQRLLS